MQQKESHALSRSVVQNAILNTFSRYSLLAAMLTNAVAEMGDRAKAKWAEKWGAADPLSVGGAGSPSNTMSPGPRPIPPYQVAS